MLLQGIVLGGIGMTECANFMQLSWRMVLYESAAIYPACATCSRIALINASMLLLLRLR